MRIVKSCLFLGCFMLVGCGGGDSSSGSTGSEGCGSMVSGSVDLSSGASFDVIAVNESTTLSIDSIHIVPFLDLSDGSNLISGNSVPACTRFRLTLSCSAFTGTQRILFRFSDNSAAVDPSENFVCGEDHVYSAGG